MNIEKSTVCYGRTDNTILELLGEPIQSLSELRRCCDLESLLAQLSSGVLTRWLEQHYYEREAAQLDGFEVNCEKDKRRLLEILGIRNENLAEWLSEDDERRLHKIRQYTQDETALQRFRQIALTQEEMARLLDAGENEILLCNGIFSVPIQKAGVRYIVLPGAVVETIYTAEQYRRAGIIIDGGKLPQAEIPESKESARQAATKNGYDFYFEDHSVFAGKMHSLLHGIEYTGSVGAPWCGVHDTTKLYREYDCADYARKHCISEMYDRANAFFSDKLMQEIADYYQQELEAVFAPHQCALRILFDRHGLTESYKGVIRTLPACKEYLVRELQGELAADPDYFHLYDLSYFIDKTGVEKCDVPEQQPDANISTLHENPVNYHCIGISDAVLEMNKDMQKMTNSFFHAAKMHYDAFCVGLERPLERLGAFLSPMEPEESIPEYLNRTIGAENAVPDDEKRRKTNEEL